jgi:hypothetical protein
MKQTDPARKDSFALDHISTRVPIGINVVFVFLKLSW